MLKVYSVCLEAVRDSGPIIRRVRTRNRPLADQLERAVCSISLNVAEGSGQRGGNRTARYLTAIGSAREARTAIEVAIALGYAPPSEKLIDKLEKIAATLINATQHR